MWKIRKNPPHKFINYDNIWCIFFRLFSIYVIYIFALLKL